MSGTTANLKVLTSAQKQQFEDEGYLVLENYLDPPGDFGALITEQSAILDEIANELLAEGLVRSTYQNLAFTERLIQLCSESGRNFPQHFDITLPFKKGTIQADTPMHARPAVFNLLTNPRLLDLAEDVVGAEIYSNPVQHIRMKLPDRALNKATYNPMVGKVSWHQDNGVLLPEIDDVNILTIWMPLTEATIENGCVAVIPGSHRRGLLQHCPTSKDVAIPDRLVPTDTPKPLPMQPGSVLLMSKLMIHSSLDNVSDNQVRISADLRYQPAGQPSGRPAFTNAGFLARSATQPQKVLRDPTRWSQNWHTLRDQLAQADDALYAQTNRWVSSNLCA